MEREKLGVWVERDWILGFQREKMIERERKIGILGVIGLESDIGGQFFKERDNGGYEFRERRLLVTSLKRNIV